MADDPVKRRQQQAQVERWTADAKKLAGAGKEGAALELYRRAADELPGAPWLQHRTAELARKLKQNAVAMSYFRRAASAFQRADFKKRAVAPLRMAWSLALDELPGSSQALVETALELMELQRGLGFAADAAVTAERSNAALTSRGFSELPARAFESDRPAPGDTPPPSSNVAPRIATPPPSERPDSARSRALARLLGRR